MKPFLSIALCITILLSLCACNKQNNEDETLVVSGEYSGSFADTDVENQNGSDDKVSTEADTATSGNVADPLPSETTNSDDAGNKNVPLPESQEGSIGLEFEFDAETNGYALTGIGSCTDQEIIIPSFYERKPVTAIGRDALKNADFIKSIDIPNTITKINVESFVYCPNLTEITIPDTITDIEPYRHPLGNYIGHSLFTFGVASDYAAFKLSYNVYENVRYLGNESNPYHALIAPIDYNLSTYSIHPDTKLIAACAFYDCKNLSEIKIPNGVTIIGAGAFECHSMLTEITIPDSVTTIEHHAFGECDYLTSVTIGKGVTSIGENAFHSLTCIRFHGDAPLFDADAFGGITATAYYDSSNPTWTEDVKQSYGGDITWVGTDF